MGEALLFASKAGADPTRVRQALMCGFAASRILEVHGERRIKRSFTPGFRIGLHQKNLNLALVKALELMAHGFDTNPGRSCAAPQGSRSRGTLLGKARRDNSRPLGNTALALGPRESGRPAHAADSSQSTKPKDTTP